MLFIGCRLTERKGSTALKAKIPAKKEDLLCDFVRRAIRRFCKKDAGVETLQVEDAAVDEAFKRVTVVSCVGYDLTDLVQNPAASLEALNSNDTPLFTSGIDIYLSITRSLTVNKKIKKPKHSATDVLMGRVVLEKEMKLLKWDINVDGEPEIHHQVMQKLYSLFEEIDLGFFDDKQKESLSAIAEYLKNTLCFIQKFWKVLLRADFPRLPSNEFDSSKLLTLLTTTTRRKGRDEKIHNQKIVGHLKFMNDLKWIDFAGDGMKPAVDLMKNEVRMLCDLLNRHRDKLSVNLVAKGLDLLDTESQSKKKAVSAAFKDLLRTVPISNNEYHTVIDHPFATGQNKRGRISKFQNCVNEAVAHVISQIKGRKYYDPMFLTDEAMNIAKFGEAAGENFLTAATRAKFRKVFRKKLAEGEAKLMFHIYGQVNGGKNPDCIFVWKVPYVHGDDHAGNVAKAIIECQQAAPKQMACEAVRHFDSIISRITDIPLGAREALRNYLFVGDPDPNKKIADEHVTFVMALAAGHPVDKSLFVHTTASNSRGGKGIGATAYDDFWLACKEVLLPNSATEERRHTDTVYASGAHSIPNLVSQATAILQKKVDNGVFDSLPPIPSTEWVRLQFVPNRADNAAAEKFTGRLEAKRAVQTRTLRKEHMDQHWVNAMTRYYLEWMVELKKKYDGVEFFGQDDKAKIAVGDKVAVSTGVRANNKGIVVVGESLLALDHDFHAANIVTSSTLRCNIPDEVSGSFFIGDDNGVGQIFVTVRDAIFDPSNVFDHCAQLIDTLRQKGLNPTVLILQTDGGPDHSMKRIAVQLALNATFRELDVDHFVVLRCAPNGSARNKVERSMSVLNLALAHVATRRGDMAPWAESAVANASSMQAIRDVAKELAAERQHAKEDVVVLKKKLAALGVIQSSARIINRALKDVDADDKVMSSTIFSVLSYLDIDVSGYASASVAATLETANGIETVTDVTLPSTALKSKLAKAMEASGQDFDEQWTASMLVPISAISQRFSRLETGNRPVVVTPRVPSEAVTALHEQLEKIDPAYSPSVFLKEHLKNVPMLVAFIDSHVVATPYSYSIQKCNNVACCGELRTPVANGIRDLVMQRQPTPQVDTKRKGHFLSRDQSLVESANTPSSVVDLSFLPSAIADPSKVDTRKKTARDTKLAKDLKLKSWDVKKVRGVLQCYHCAKPRCIYSPVEDGYNAAAIAMQQKLESVSCRFSCGDLLFDDSHPLSKVLVQKQALTCETRIENGYFNHKDRKLKLTDICIYCGEGGSEDVLLCQPQLRQRKLTGGKQCYPICTACLKCGKKVVKSGRKDATNARSEKAG